MVERLSAADIDFVHNELNKLDELPVELPFPVEEYLRRQDLVRRRMQDSGIDLLLVTSPEGIAWLTGHALRWNKGQGPTVWPALQTVAVYASASKVILFETPEHEEIVRLRSMVEDVRLSATEDLRGVIEHIIRELRSEGWLAGQVGVEKWSYIPNRAVGEAVEEAVLAAGASRVVDASMLMRRVRSVKSELELEYLEKAACAVDAGLLAMEAAIRPGVREIELWAELVRGMVIAGGEPAALHELVNSSSRLGHAFSSDRRLRVGDYVRADPCGVVQHYHVNVAVTWFLGTAPAAAHRISEAAGGAYEVLCRAARAGRTIGEVSSELKSYYEEIGSWGTGIHGYTGGYELGLSFPPDWVGEIAFTLGTDENSEVVLEENMVFNFESILHFSMIDTWVVGQTGSRTLSRLPHHIREVRV